ncbi:MAG: hypothetical protein NZ555_10680 [Geminicoccaceae bacterium]|nr:hypothetical protein [Geminicoccaceae bacterium]
MVKILEEPKDLPGGTRHLFLAEGAAEVGLLSQILRSLCAGEDAVITCVKGVERIGPLVKRLVQPPAKNDLASVTVVADADNDPRARLDQIWGAFPIDEDSRAYGEKEGSVVVGATRYAAWLSPGCGKSGRIEDLVLGTVDPKTRNCVRELWRCATGAKKKKSPSSKAEVAIVIALRADEGLGLGSAFEKGLVHLDHRAFDPLRILLREQLAHQRP